MIYGTTPEIVADDEDLTGVEVRSVNELVARLNDALATTRAQSETRSEAATPETRGDGRSYMGSVAGNVLRYRATDRSLACCRRVRAARTWRAEKDYRCLSEAEE